MILSISVSDPLSLKVFCVKNISSPFFITTASLDFHELNGSNKEKKKTLSFYCSLFRQFLENHSCPSYCCVIIGLFQVTFGHLNGNILSKIYGMPHTILHVKLSDCSRPTGLV
jgi:hypothetical protein